MVNPRAGGGRARRIWGRERARLTARFGPIETRETSGPGDASRLAIELYEAGHDLLFIAGGDGTLNEAANGLLAGGAPAALVTLAPLVAGHCSDLARTLAPGDEPRLIDAVQATFHDAGGRMCERWFVNMASFGLGAEVVRRAGGSGRYAYLLAAAVALAGRRPVELRLAYGGEVVETRAVHVAVGNGSCQGGGMRLCPQASLDDGLFDVSLIGDVGLLDLVVNLGLLYSGRIYDHPKVRHFRTAALRVEGEAGLELDGEPAGFLPAGFRVVPGALSMLGLG